MTVANSLEILCPKNEIFIKLIDENENLDNFFFNQNNDLTLFFKKINNEKKEEEFEKNFNLSEFQSTFFEAIQVKKNK